MKHHSDDNAKRSSAIDLMRILAAALVTAQHALTLTDHSEWTMLGRINLGQIGVALFFALSGHLNAVTSREPWPWLKHRLLRLYPAYWLALAVSFVLAALAQHKPLSVPLVVSQFAGTGLITHRVGDLVNVATWFVSALLICYVVQFAARLSGIERPVMAVIAGLLVVATFTGQLRWPWCFLATYFLASLATGPGGKRRRIPALLIAGCVCLGLALWRQPFVYSGIALCLVAGSISFSRSLPWTTVAVQYSYEYFLVHGVCLWGTIRLMPQHPAGATLLGILLAMICSVALQRAADFLVSACSMSRTFAARSTQPVELPA